VGSIQISCARPISLAKELTFRLLLPQHSRSVLDSACIAFFCLQFMGEMRRMKAGEANIEKENLERPQTDRLSSNAWMRKSTEAYRRNAQCEAHRLCLAMRSRSLTESDRLTLARRGWNIVVF